LTSTTVGEPDDDDFEAKLQFLRSQVEKARGDGDHETLGESLAQLALALSESGTAARKLGYPRAALALLGELVPILDELGQPGSVAGTLDILGGIFMDLDNAEEALRLREKALSMFREIGDHSGEVTTLSNTGRTYYQLGDLVRALDIFQEAIGLYRTAEDREGEATALVNAGCVLNELGDPVMALEYHNKAMPLYRDTGDRKGEATVLNNISGFHHGLGDLELALESCQQALHIYRELGDRFEESVALNNIGRVHHDLGDPTQAIKFYESSLLIAQEIGDRDGEATTLNNIGRVYRSQSELERALQFFGASLEIHEGTGNRRGEASALNNMGRVQMDLGDPERAIDSFSKSLPIRRETGDRRGEATTLNNIATLHLLVKDPEKALTFVEAALLILRDIGARSDEADGCNNVAYIHRLLGNVSEALHYYRESIRVREAMRADVKDEDHRLGFFSTQIDVYTAFTDFLVSEAADPDSEIHELLDDPVGEAFRVSERSRARVFLELLSKPAQDALLDSDLELSPEGESVVEPEEVLPSAELLPVIRDELLSDGKTVLLEYVLAEKNSMLFVVTKDRFEVIATLPSKSVVEGMVRELREFASWAPGMRGNPHYTRSYPHGKELFDVLIRPALEFRDTNGNLRPLIGDDDELLIVADGVLNLLPFQLLLTEKPGRKQAGNETQRPERSDEPKGEVRDSKDSDPFGALAEKLRTADREEGPFDFPNLAYLTRTFPIRQIASAQAAIETAKSSDARGLAGGVALFASPLSRFPSPDEARSLGGLVSARLGASLAAARSGLGSLQHAAAEVQNIERQIRENAPDLRFDPEPNLAATRLDVLDASGSDSLVTHFSCHGLINNETPDLSGLVFEPSGDEPFTVFTASEILKAGIRSELTVLSACDTGHGKLVEGEGAIALTRSFLASGSRSVVASLWKVPDLATKELMKLFYSNLIEGDPRGEALRQAQLDLAKDPQFSHPANWAAFSLTGAGGPVF